MQCCQLIDAIWQDDIDAVRDLVLRNPNLIHEDALVRKSNWGRPMSYAANLGRDEIIRMLRGLVRPIWSTLWDEPPCKAKWKRLVYFTK